MLQLITTKSSESVTDKLSNLAQTAGENMGLIESNMSVINGAYFVAAILFIFSLAGLSKQESAENGVWYGIIGMAIALVATIMNPSVTNMDTIIIAMVIGGLIGTWFALRVEMTEMPELVALLHSFVGLAAVAVGYNSFLEHEPMTGIMKNIHLVEVFLGVFIGAVTFTGSIVAFGKLKGIFSSASLMLPHRHKLNLLAGIVSFALMVYFVQQDGHMNSLLIMTVIALVF